MIKTQGNYFSLQSMGKEKEKLFTQMKKTGNYEIKDVSIYYEPYKITQRYDI